MAQYAATVSIAAGLAHVALDLPWPYADPLREVWGEIAEAATTAPPEVRAIRDLLSWCVGHAETFWGHHRTDTECQPIPPNAGWSGAWPPDGAPALLPTVADKVLTELGHAPDAVLSAWGERGWMCTEGRHLTVKRTTASGIVRLHALTAAALAEAGIELPTPPPPMTPPAPAGGEAV